MALAFRAIGAPTRAAAAVGGSRRRRTGPPCRAAPPEQHAPALSQPPPPPTEAAARLAPWAVAQVASLYGGAAAALGFSGAALLAPALFGAALPSLPPLAQARCGLVSDAAMLAATAALVAYGATQVRTVSGGGGGEGEGGGGGGGLRAGLAALGVRYALTPAALGAGLATAAAGLAGNAALAAALRAPAANTADVAALAAAAGGAAPGGGAAALALLAAGAVLLGPLHEELFFRGFLQPALGAAGAAPAAAVAATAAAFALGHASPGDAPQLLSLGLALGALRASRIGRDNLAAPTLAHAAYNAAIFAALAASGGG